MTVDQVTVVGWDAEVCQLPALRTLRRQAGPRVTCLERITRVARHVLGMPAFLCLRDTDDRWLTSGSGLSGWDTPHLVSLCSLAVGSGPVTEILDLACRQEFAVNPLVAGPPRLRFYAGLPVRARSGQVVGFLCVLDRCPRGPLSGVERSRLGDLVAWAELECATAQASRGLRAAVRNERDFVAVVSHEMRTPLTSVHGSLELLHSGLAGVVPAPAGQLVDIAVKNIERLVRLVNDVLDLSRAQRGELRLGDVALDDVIGQAVDAVAGTARRSGVAVVARPANVSLRGDSDRLVQVVTNLLANAVSLSPPDEIVEVCCENGGSHAWIHVTDRGPGVTPEQLDRIFEPFVQVGPEGRRRGTGLGLAITRGIVESHGGTVSARSAPGAGATFTVSLPIKGPQDDRPWW